MSTIENSIQAALAKRKAENAFRQLSQNQGFIDFCSNDYLGFARSEKLKEKLICSIKDEKQLGSTGSRLISGNSEIAEELEKFIANYHFAEAALIFNSGYAANTGFFSCVPQRGDTVIYDELVHASIRDGIRLGLANSFPFRHNDISNLEDKLRRARGNIFVVVESVYSMDGDSPNLHDISDLSDKYNAALVVDEAHAVGVFGEGGRGMVVEDGLHQKVFARIITFGKALGCHGAAVLGSKNLRDYLINFSRPFIYTTAMPGHGLNAVRNAYGELEKISDNIHKIRNIIKLFKQKIEVEPLQGNSPIISLIIPGNDRVKSIARKVQEAGFDVRPVLSPTVRKGSERLRICMHSFNTDDEVVALAETINKELD